jgi:hypothetical protein
MDPVTIAAALAAATEVVRLLVRQIELARLKGEITDAQMADIRARAAISDAQWDAAVTAARRQLEHGPEEREL